VDHINFPYRSTSHLALMHIVAECGAFERQNLHVDYDKPIGREDAHRLVPTGEIEFTSGNHVSTYAARVRGDNWVYLGQSVSLNHLNLVVRADSEINKLEDMRKKKFGSKGRHPGLNDWLYLKQHGLDVDRDDVEFLQFGSVTNDSERKKLNLIEAVKTGAADGCFLSQPKREFAEREGLKIIPMKAQPMVFFATVSSSLPFVQKHPDIAKRMLKALIDGIAYIKTHPQESIRILMEKHNKEGKLDLDTATKLYNELAPTLEPKLYPSLEAVFNVYEEAKRQSKEAEKIHPLALWDFHLLREIDDSGYIDDLYAKYNMKAQARAFPAS
jgi:ABC-type nitrate/sulfonate/bicarbonate transport system substrate-binding protein